MSTVKTEPATKLHIISEPREIIKMWNKLVPFFQRAIDEAVHGEFSLSSLKKLIDSRYCFIAYIEDDHEILMTLAMEFKPYPELKVLNVMAMAGRRMHELFIAHHQEIASFARSFGVDEFESSGSDGMRRMLESVGWYKAYNVMRFKI